MANIDLKDALQLFKQGAQDLMFSRALSTANDEVQQIKASEMNEQEQRAQLQQVSNGLVNRMAQLGVPATTMEMVNRSIQGPKMNNANDMARQAILTGNEQLFHEAEDMQAFEGNLQQKLALISAKYSGLAALREQKQDDKDVGFFKEYAKSMNSALASSRSGYGQWSSVENRGERLNAILGDSSRWTAFTPEELELVKEGVVQMSKGGVMTQAEHKALSPFIAKLAKARAETAVTGKPVHLDLSGHAGLFKGIIDREGKTATDKMATVGLTIATGNLKLAKRDPEQFKITTAINLSQNLGRALTPEDIIIDKDKVKIKPGAIAKAPRLSTALGLEESAESTNTSTPPSQTTPPNLIPTTIKGPGGKEFKGLKDPVTGKLYRK